MKAFHSTLGAFAGSSCSIFVQSARADTAAKEVCMAACVRDKRQTPSNEFTLGINHPSIGLSYRHERRQR